MIGIGELLNTDHVRKTGIQEKENVYIFGNQLKKVNNKLKDI